MAEGTETIRQDIDAIRDSMTTTMEQIESRVKGTVDTTVENVKRTFDIKQHIADQPWMAIGVAIAAGYVLGSQDGGSGPMRYAGYDAADNDQSTAANLQQKPHKPGIIDEVIDQFGDELNVLKAAAIGVAVNMVRDTIQQNVPQIANAYQRAQRERPASTSPVASASVAPQYSEAVRANGHNSIS